MGPGRPIRRLQQSRSRHLPGASGRRQSAASVDGKDVDPGPGVFTLRSSPGSETIFIQHTNAQGNLISAGQIGGSGFARPLAVCKDPGGNILISGTSGDTIDLDPGAGVMKIFQDAAFVVQLNPQGAFMRASDCEINPFLRFFRLPNRTIFDLAT